MNSETTDNQYSEFKQEKCMNSETINDQYIEFKQKKKFISILIDELIAVNMLERNNKDWLSGNDKTRCEAIAKTLHMISNELNALGDKL